jgi:hypothetical protein
MKPRTDHERLLADVLAAEADPAFSAGVLAATLRQAQRRRRGRQVRQCGGALAVLLAVAFGASPLFRSSPKLESVQLPSPPSYRLVLSQPLPPDQIVSTRSFALHQTVTFTETVNVVQTTPGGFREIGEDELIALAAPSVVALVRRGPHEAELVFVSVPPEPSDAHPN